MTDRPDPMVPAEVRTREQAAEAGAVRYFSGAPCPNGHTAERYTLNGYCVECQRAQNRADRAAIKSRRRAA